METKTQLSMNIFSKPVDQKKGRVLVYIAVIFVIALAYLFFNALDKNISMAESRGIANDAVMAGSGNKAGSPGLCTDRCGDGSCDQQVQKIYGRACYESEYNCQKDCASSLAFFPGI